MVAIPRLVDDVLKVVGIKVPLGQDLIVLSFILTHIIDPRGVVQSTDRTWKESRDAIVHYKLRFTKLYMRANS